MSELIEKLKDLGLNSYEAKVYVALLKKYPATGYEVSKLANIPQARAYDTLKALEIDQIVTASNAKPQTYTPIKPKELTKRYKRRFDSTIDFLEKKLPNVKDTYTEPILNINGHSQIIQKAIEIIKNAKNELYIALWAQEYKYLENCLLDAYNKGLDIRMVGYDEFSCPFGTIFKHTGAMISNHSFGKRFLFLAADDNEGVFGKTEMRKNEEGSALWTKNHEIVYMIKSFIVHDMYLIDIENNFPEQLRYFYGSGLKKLKEKVLTNSLKLLQ